MFKLATLSGVSRNVYYSLYAQPAARITNTTCADTFITIESARFALNRWRIRLRSLGDVLLGSNAHIVKECPCCKWKEGLECLECRGTGHVEVKA